MRAYWIVGRKARRLVGGQVSEVHPVPGGDEDIFGLDVAMADSGCMALSQSLQQLVCYPALHEVNTACIERAQKLLSQWQTSVGMPAAEIDVATKSISEDW